MEALKQELKVREKLSDTFIEETHLERLIII